MNRDVITVMLVSAVLIIGMLIASLTIRSVREDNQRTVEACSCD